MNNDFLFIGEEHIGSDASPADARRVTDLLRVEGWKVSYGDRPWQFANDDQRAAFEKAFRWAMAVMKAERQDRGDDVLLGLVKQRFELNDKLKAHESRLLQERPNWPRYYHWLLETPTDVILNWLGQKEKDVPKG